MRAIRLSRLIAVVVFFLAGEMFAQESEEGARNERLPQMKAIAEAIELRGVVDDPDSLIPLIDEPILRYLDSTRESRDAALWVWSKGGRPSAIVAIEWYPKYKGAPNWLYEIVSLSKEPIEAKSPSRFDWKATKPGLEFLAVPDAPAPAETKTRRLAQMRQLLSRFAARESAVVEGRIELRAMPRPLYRYEDETTGTVDGAVFAFANGTNPEVFLILEALVPDGDNERWRYALAQMTGGAIRVLLDESEVWSCREADPPAVRERYFNGWLKADDVAQP